MGQNILGLDIGKATIKGVRLAKGLRGTRLIDSFVRVVPRTEGPTESGPLKDAQIEVLKTLLLEAKILPGDLIALSIPGDVVSTHEMRLPFSDPKKLQQIVPFEAEAQLPFDLDAVTLDYMTLADRPQSELEEAEIAVGQHQSRLLVSAIRNDTLRAYLTALQPIGIDPAWIGPNPLGLYAFAQYFLETPVEENADIPSNILVIDLGAARTVLCSLSNGTLDWVRTLPMGSDLITALLQKDLGLSWDDAEEKKETIGLQFDQASEEQGAEAPEDAKAAAVIQKGVALLQSEIEKTLRAFSPSRYKASSEGETLGAFHLCGGGGTLSGLRTHLAETLEMEAVPLNRGPKSRAGTVIGLDSVNADLASSVYAQAFGVAFQESDGPPINFRKGPFVFGKESREKRRHFVTIGLIGLVLLALMAGNLSLRFNLKENRYQRLKQDLRARFTEAFPEVKNVVSEVDQTRSAISTLHRTGAFLGVDEMSPLAALKEISDAIPEGVKIDVFDIVIDSGKIRIQAQTDSFESVDRIRGGLLSAPHFQGVEVSDAKVMADQKQVRFRIKMDVSEGGRHGKNRPS